MKEVKTLKILAIGPKSQLQEACRYLALDYNIRYLKSAKGKTTLETLKNTSGPDCLIVDTSEWNNYLSWPRSYKVNIPILFLGNVPNLTPINKAIPKEEPYYQVLDFIISNLIKEHKSLKQSRAKQASLKREIRNKNFEAKKRLKFYANMSHEIRTPLNGVMGFLNLLKDGISSQPYSDYVENARGAAQHLHQVINDLLDFSKIKISSIKIEHKNFNPKDCFESAFNLFSTIAIDKNLKMSLNWDNKIPECLIGDPLRLKQVLINIIGNAVKFTNEGGSISVDIVCEKIDRHCTTFNCTIKDSGIGIPKNRLSSIFDPFSLASNITQNYFGGTGLGLSICKNMIEQMGGRIKVKSREGAGTTFYLKLSLPNAVSLKKYKYKTINRDIIMSAASKKIILIAEDNTLNQKLLESMLQTDKYETIIVSNGAEALEKITDNKSVDLILMDINMPILDGIRASEKIRASGKDTPIIALSAENESDYSEKLEKAGIDAYLPKPIDRQKLFDTLDQYLN